MIKNLFFYVTGQEDPNYAQYSNDTGHLQQKSQLQYQNLHPGEIDFVLTDDSTHATAIESGDRVTLVDREGKESPVLVRILRAVTPRTFSARLARSRWRQDGDGPEDADQEAAGMSARPPRIFEIVREQSQQDVSVSCLGTVIIDIT